MAEPKKNEAFAMDVVLVDSADPTVFVSSPTIAAGDFQVSTDGGTYANLATLPVVTPSGSRTVLMSLSADEMNGDRVSIQGVDAAGSEWAEIFITINPPTSNTDDVFNILEGDHVETSTRLIVNLKDTSTALIDKEITGSLLSSNITINTKES